MAKSQESVGQYVRQDINAGTLDLDEADAGLRHIGSSLRDFLANIPARELTEDDDLLRKLAAKPPLRGFVEDLTHVPKTKLDAVLAFAQPVVQMAIAKRGGGKFGRRGEVGRGARTTKGRGPRR